MWLNEYGTLVSPNVYVNNILIYVNNIFNVKLHEQKDAQTMGQQLKLNSQMPITCEGSILCSGGSKETQY